MSSFTLTPSQSAKLAKNVYALTDFSSMREAVTFVKGNYNDSFIFPEEFVMTARTGGPAFIKSRTAFGMFLLGQKNFSGHAVIMIRGTVYLGDWLTNLNISVSSSATGQPIHDGFNQAFMSMVPSLKTLLPLLRKHQVHTVHCVGHSLGGALATICADWLYSNMGIKPFLYTFGSPRVGFQTFARQCTSKVSAERIFRSYHRTDIVPCIPPWPFTHTPFESKDYFLPSPGVIPGAEYHSMSKYIESASGKTWETMGAFKDELRNETAVKLWLKGTSPIMFTVSSIEWLSRAMSFVIEKCLKGIAFGISKAAEASFTIMDQLAYILHKGIDISQNISSWVMCLIRRIMQILGYRAEVEAAELTYGFIRNLLLRLQTKVNEFAKKAFSDALVDGRGI